MIIFIVHQFMLNVSCTRYFFFIAGVSVGWAMHQVHHSSEHYNLTTPMRMHAFRNLSYYIFYLPVALLGVPLSAILVHTQFILLYGFWVHTELISTLGPLEYILVTPSHHRVHHGKIHLSIWIFSL